MTIKLQLLGRTIKQVQYKHHRAMDSRLASIRSTMTQWDALRAIDRQPGASAHKLAQATFQTDQAFGTLANRLEAQGLIERRPGYGRRIEHRLTPEGQRIFEAGTAVAEEILRDSFKNLSEEERETLLNLLNKVIGEDLT
jgi:DNA-binding MarR family transcriptional regulator